MEKFKINTALFGEIEFTTQGGVWENYDIALGGREMTVRLSIADYYDKNWFDDDIGVVKNMLNHITQLYDAAKKALFDGMASNKLISYFIDFHIEEVEQIAEIMGVGSREEITPAMFVDKLGLRTIGIAKDKADTIVCTLDFSIPAEYSDELLVVRFDGQYKILGISHES